MYDEPVRVYDAVVFYRQKSVCYVRRLRLISRNDDESRRDHSLKVANDGYLIVGGGDAPL